LRKAALPAVLRLRRRDRSLGLAFEDGSAARVFEQEVALERTGQDHAGQAGVFARLYAGLCGWVDNHEGSAWPFPRPSQLGMPLAGSASALRRHIGRRLRTSRVLLVCDLEDRRRVALDMLMEEFDLDVPSEARHGDNVLILTSRCRAELAKDPDLFLDRLAEFHRADADTGVISLGAGNHAERFSSLSAVLDELQTAMSTDSAYGSLSPLER
jgi:hypothetical protein